MSKDSILFVEANKRDETLNLSQLRHAGLIPAVLYGYQTENISLTLPASQFEKIYKQAGESTIVGLKIDNGEPLNVLIHDLQRHGTKGHVLHVDFYKVNMAKKLKATVPIRFVGEAPAVKQLAGTLVHPVSEIEVESLPMDLPHEIEVDVSGLQTFDDVIRVRDLKIDRRKVEILADAEQVVTKVEPPRSEEELAELEAAPVAVDVTKVEGIEKKETEPGVEGSVAEDKGKEA